MGGPARGSCSPRMRSTPSGQLGVRTLAQRESVCQGRLPRLHRPSGRKDAVRPDGGTKARGGVLCSDVPAGSEHTRPPAAYPGERGVRLTVPRFRARSSSSAKRSRRLLRRENPAELTGRSSRPVSRQAYARSAVVGACFYHYVVSPTWINGVCEVAAPPGRDVARQADQPRLVRTCSRRDVLSVPDKWEYPAFFAWDLAFHMDSDGPHRSGLPPRTSCSCYCAEWYLHPNGQLPCFLDYDPSSNVNPRRSTPWPAGRCSSEPAATDHTPFWKGRFISSC